MLAYYITTLLALGLIDPVRADEVVCYAPDGKTVGDNETYVPCNKLGITQSGVYSSCCQLDGDPDERDLCTTSGLCIRGSVLSRGYCTDKTWGSPACVNVCTSKDEGGSSNETVQMTSCTDGTYCCGNNNLTCCGTDFAITIPTQPSVITDDDDESTTTETAYVTETSTPSTFKNATIGLAVVVGVVALAALGAILYLLRRNRSLYAQLNAQTPPPETPAKDTPMTQTTQPYHDSTYGAPTTAASSPHMQQREYSAPHQFKPAYAHTPISPGISEVEGTQRYSELDAGGHSIVNRADMTSAQGNNSPYATPMHSPRLE